MKWFKNHFLQVFGLAGESTRRIQAAAGLSCNINHNESEQSGASCFFVEFFRFQFFCSIHIILISPVMYDIWIMLSRFGIRNQSPCNLNGRNRCCRCRDVWFWSFTHAPCSSWTAQLGPGATNGPDRGRIRPFLLFAIIIMNNWAALNECMWEETKDWAWKRRSRWFINHLVMSSDR